MPEALVINASPLIFLSHVEGIGWLTQLSKASTFITEAVLEEIAMGDGGRDIVAALRQNASFTTKPTMPVSIKYRRVGSRGR